MRLHGGTRDSFGGTNPHPCKKRKDGPPRFELASKGGPPAPQGSICKGRKGWGQGDLEYIEYDSLKRDEAFKRTNEVVTKIIAGNLQLRSEPTLRQEAQAPPAEPAPQQEKKPDKPGLSPYVREIFKGLSSGDPRLAQKGYEAGLAYLQQSDPEKTLFFTVFYHNQRAPSGYPEGLDDLKVLESQNPDSSYVPDFIGRTLQKLGDFKGGAEAFERAAAKSQRDEKANYFLSAAECQSSAKATAATKALLLKALESATPRQRLEVIARLYDSLKLHDSKYDAFAVGEYSLQSNGAQPDLRFRLAYDYAESNLNELAAYHYHIVLEQREEMDGAKNNLANILGALALPVSAVELYKEAMKSGSSLAAGNLAFRYLNAGMMDEAKEVVSEAMKEDMPDPMVTDALAAIGRRRQDEDKKYDDILLGTAAKRAFFAAMGEALLAKDEAVVGGFWGFPSVTIELTSERSPEGYSLRGIAEKPIYPSGFLLILSPSLDRTKPSETEVHEFRGTLVGRVCKFEMSVQTKGIYGTPSTSGKNQRRDGYIVFSRDGKRADVLEIEPKIGLYEIMHDVPSGEGSAGNLVSPSTLL